MNDANDAKCIVLHVSEKELRYFIACGIALMQHIPSGSLPTYCGMTKEEIIEISLRLRGQADDLGVDM
ncbi:hypothetical protein [Pseudomonas abietaniphila]|uniref:Uncharacterized protein n=1 Tax=Pseudomonas abietaniphila TaxID=89065 RepID=A0A1G8BK12_9PSED|nr:hypothetical protein [Pseudomonas abietaniphila]SDH33562.1 hypothetical protein SAMN05216605_1063 [Pseudomonas abietaniphila]